MEKENNKRNFYIVMIVILIIFLIGIISLIYVFKSDKFEKGKESETEESKKEDENNETEKINIYHYDISITGNDLEIAKAFDKKYEEFNLYVLNSLTKKVTDFNALTNDEKLMFLEKYYGSGNFYSDGDFFTSVSEADFKTYFSSVFKDEIEFENRDLLCHNSYDGKYHCHVKYDEETKKYEYDYSVEENCYGLTEEIFPEYYSKLINIEKKENIYTLTYVKMFYPGSGDAPIATEFYDHYVNDFSEKPNFIVEGNRPENYVPEKYIEDKMNAEENFDKYDKYIYTIDTSNDEVLLVGYEYENVK